MKTQRPVSLLIIVCAVSAACLCPTHAAMLRVGHSAAYDYTTITDALAAASTGDTITVAAGTYKHGALYPETFPLVMKSGVRLVWETPGIQPVIDAKQGSRVITCENLVAGAGTLIEGFVITGGVADPTDLVGSGLAIMDSDITVSECDIVSNYCSDSGGGIYCYRSNVTLRHCLVDSNIADQGGGIFITTGSNIRVEWCVFSSNTTTYSGAGICLDYDCSAYIEGSEFSGNTASQYGGGIFCNHVDANIYNCLFENNTGVQMGGGMCVMESTIFGNQSAWIGNTSPKGAGIVARENAVLQLFECVIGQNSAADDGGGIYANMADIELLHTKIAANSAVSAGGGLLIRDSSGILASCEFLDNHSVNGGGIAFESGATTRTVNCLFARNRATEFGGGLFFDASSPDLMNCTLTDNYAADGGGAFAVINSNPVLTNSILWDNEIDEVFIFSGTPEITFCDVTGGWSASATNLDADPLCVLGPGGSFYLSQTAAGQSADSPCVNAGNVPAAAISYHAIDQDFYLDAMTTRTDSGNDTGQADIGYHYQPFYNNCSFLGCSISMPSVYYHPGDPFYCYAVICNPDLITYSDIPVFVLLDVYGTYFFAPGFSEFDYYVRDVYPGKTTIEVLPEFAWPPGTGTASGIAFYAAMTNHQMTELFGALAYVSFGWGE